MKAPASLLVFLSLIMLSGVDALAQCAMCRATVEASIIDGQTTIASGLNTGILYLLVMPYLLIGVIAFFWYRNSKANAKKIQVRGYRQG
jgi:amino acid transporter